MAPFSSFVFVFLLCVASSYAIKTVDVEIICKKVTNSSFCSTLLNSAPDASRDLVSLAKYTLNVAHANVTNTVNLIHKLIAQSGGNVVAKSHYVVCLVHFDEKTGTLDTIEALQQALTKGYYKEAFSMAVNIGDDVSDCLTGEAPGDPPFHDTSLLPKYAGVIDLIGQTIVSIFSFLA